MNVMNARTHMLNGMELFNRAARIGFAVALALLGPGHLSASAAPVNSIKPAPEGNIPVAFLISEGAVVIDFCGPWEVFRQVNAPGHDEHAFRLYTVADTTNPI